MESENVVELFTPVDRHEEITNNVIQTLVCTVLEMWYFNERSEDQKSLICIRRDFHQHTHNDFYLY